MAKKILVCDDSQTIRQAVDIALATEQVDVVMVGDAGQVVSTALEVSPDLILLDNRMNRNGEDDGYDLCRALKAEGALASVPVLFLAGRSYDQTQGQAAGSTDVIPKPFETQKDSTDLKRKPSSKTKYLSGDLISCA